MDQSGDEGSFTLNITSVPVRKRKNKIKIHNEESVVEPHFESNVEIPQSSFSGKSQAKVAKKKSFHDPNRNVERESPNNNMQVPRRDSFLQNTQVISSLFKSNPTVEPIDMWNKESKMEELFSKKSFGDLNLHPHLVSCLQSRFNISTLTQVQEKTIPVLLSGNDALVKSCTGSGKTLAYAIPIIEKLQEVRPKIQRSDGVLALIILPTRELVLQSYDCFSMLTKAFTWIVPGYLIGGEKKKSEKARIRKGINILISTPGRILDHLDHTANLELHKIQWLVVDEADRLLEQGFEESVLNIIRRCSDESNIVNRQTVLLSATLTRGVENLAGISMKNPTCIDISRMDENDTKMNNLVVPSQLKQYVVVTPMKLRLVTLSAFIIQKCVTERKKALIFFCTQSNVDFHFALLSNELKDLFQERSSNAKFFKLHGNMKQEERSDIFHQFKASTEGVLLCTDVAARGLDLPLVDWIVQYSLPSSVEGYVHRVGRTARIGKTGQSLLFVIPSELQFVNLLQEQQLRLEELEMNNLLSSLLFLREPSFKKHNQSRIDKSKLIEECASKLQLKFEEAVYAEKDLHAMAKEAFLTFVQAYSSYPYQLRSVIPFKELHLGHAAKCLCLRESPTQLGHHVARPSFKNSRQNSKPPAKRQQISEVSEYSSGFDMWKPTENDSKQKKRRKY